MLVPSPPWPPLSILLLSCIIPETLQHRHRCDIAVSYSCEDYVPSLYPVRPKFSVHDLRWHRFSFGLEYCHMMGVHHDMSNELSIYEFKVAYEYEQSSCGLVHLKTTVQEEHH